MEEYFILERGIGKFRGEEIGEERLRQWAECKELGRGIYLYDLYPRPEYANSLKDNPDAVFFTNVNPDIKDCYVGRLETARAENGELRVGPGKYGFLGWNGQDSDGYGLVYYGPAPEQMPWALETRQCE